MLRGRFLFLFLLAAAVAIGADDAKKPGTITYVEGAVYLQDELAHVDDDAPTVMAIGQHLRTNGGNAEVFATPGSLIRMGTTAEIEMISSDDESATLRLVRGSIFIEVFRLKKPASLVIVVGDTKTTVEAKGEFRFDAKDDNASALHVVKGKALLASGDSSQELKKKQMAEVTLAGVQVAKYKDLPYDALTIWHQRRAEVDDASVYGAPGYFGMGELPDASRAGIKR